MINEEAFSFTAEATWLVISDGMGDGGLEWVLASWETKPESWEETLLSRWAPAEGIWSKLLAGYHNSIKLRIHIQQCQYECIRIPSFCSENSLLQGKDFSVSHNKNKKKTK